METKNKLRPKYKGAVLEKPVGKSLTETEGYVTLKQRVGMLREAGQNLRDFRSRNYHTAHPGASPSNVDMRLRGQDVDIADISEADRELVQRTRDLHQRVLDIKKVRAENAKALAAAAAGQGAGFHPAKPGAVPDGTGGAQ